MFPHFTMSLTPLLISGSWFCYACCKILKLPFLKSHRGRVFCSLLPFSLVQCWALYWPQRWKCSIIHQHSSCWALETAMQLMNWFQILLNWNLIEIATCCWWLSYWKPRSTVPSAHWILRTSLFFFFFFLMSLHSLSGSRNTPLLMLLFFVGFFLY